jgi:hypothetical protein
LSAALGGPVNAGVLGMGNPVLDINGEVIINSLIELMKNCVDNSLVIDGHIKDVIVREGLPFIVKEDGDTRFCTKNR